MTRSPETDSYPQRREPAEISRRNFLRLVTVTLGGLALGACSVKEEPSVIPKVPEGAKRPTELPPRIEDKPWDYFPN